ncbi:hypothetical protein C1I95_17815 [Micromonospora craterilacus]|uniref:Uncharacterized protein n=1 Tax=Micromonospora craterilacus TaxID=1655439 RepID=A0A2W2E117_9ACTN|nr:hypothetical protein [Micromonospora craterilacus]PZG16373.1 hypothetical protein C1I95_17815 [Micromonospora craterilacus]
MAHGEAEHGCAQGEPCRPGLHEQPAAKHHRRPTGLTHPVEPAAGWTPERPEEESLPARPRAAEPAVPRQRGPEPAAPRQLAAEPSPSGQAEPATAGCRSHLPGWAGAHRHGPVRPAHRNARRERPPRRWC